MEWVVVELPVPRLWHRVGKTLYDNAKAGARFGTNTGWKLGPFIGIPSAIVLGAGIGLTAEMVQLHVNPEFFANVPTGLKGGYAVSGGLLGIFANTWVDAFDTEKNKPVYGFASYCGKAAGFVLGPVLAPVARKFRAVAEEVSFTWREVHKVRALRKLQQAGESASIPVDQPSSPLNIQHVSLRKEYILPLPKGLRRFLNGKNAPLRSEELQPYTDLERELPGIIQGGDPTGTFIERAVGIAENPRLQYHALVLLSLVTLGKSQLDKEAKLRALKATNMILDNIPGRREQAETIHATLCAMYAHLQGLDRLGIGRTEAEQVVTSPIEALLIKRFGQTLERMPHIDRFNTLFTRMINGTVYGLVGARPLPDGFSQLAYMEARYKKALDTLLPQNGVDDRWLRQMLRKDLHHLAPHKYPAPN